MAAGSIHALTYLEKYVERAWTPLFKF